jgi:transmembrane sensor
MSARYLPLNPRLIEEASTWLIELSEDDADVGTRKQFAQWLRTSPEHIRAFLKVSATWEHARAIGKNSAEDTDLLVAQALAEDNIVRLSAATQVAAVERGTSRRRIRLFGFAALILIALAVPSVWFYLWSGTYSTGMGEQRSIVLSDGSTVDLNTRSRIRVRFTGSQRRVDLLKGQALFQVAHDAARPFVVRSDTAQVRAVGTQFDVYRARSGTTVTVLEGRVAVVDTRAQVRAPSEKSFAASESGESADGNAIFVAAGEQLTIGSKAPARPVVAATGSDMPWRQRRLEFHATPLASVVEEYNRYHERHLRIDDAALEQLPISGVFSATDSASLIAFLREQPHVIVRESGPEIEIALE